MLVVGGPQTQPARADPGAIQICHVCSHMILPNLFQMPPPFPYRSQVNPYYPVARNMQPLGPGADLFKVGEEVGTWSVHGAFTLPIAALAGRHNRLELPPETE